MVRLSQVQPVESSALENTLHASVATTASGNSNDLPVSAYVRGVFYLDVTVVSGTNPTLDVIIEGKDALSGTYFTLATFAQKIAAGFERKELATLFDGWIRAKWTIGGTDTPTFTFTVGAVLKS